MSGADPRKDENKQKDLYEEMSGLLFQWANIRFYPEDLEKMVDMEHDERMAFVTKLRQENRYIDLDSVPEDEPEEDYETWRQKEFERYDPCCICGRRAPCYNNPDPLRPGTEDCCDECNRLVIAARRRRDALPREEQEACLAYLRSLPYPDLKRELGGE